MVKNQGIHTWLAGTLIQMGNSSGQGASLVKLTSTLMGERLGGKFAGAKMYWTTMGLFIAFLQYLTRF